MTLDVTLVANSKTWNVLRNTRNPAATVLLGAGLMSPLAEVRLNCLKALIHRNSDSGNMLILSRWSMYDQKDRRLLREHSQQFTTAARSLLSGGSTEIRELMLSAIFELGLYDCVDVLIELATNSKHPLNPQATSCLLALCRTRGKACQGGDSRWAAERETLIKILYDELLRFPKSDILMSAWLSVAHWDDGQQRRMIGDTSQPVYMHMLKTLAETSDPAALQLLAGYFWRSTTPNSIQSIICEHPNPMLAVEMAKLFDDENLESIIHRLRSSSPLACMKSLNIDELKLERPVYRRLLLMMAASREDLAWSLSICTALAKGSSSESRRLAAEVLQWSRAVSLENLIVIIQEDDTSNGANKVVQEIREIISWLKNPSVVLRQAASRFFSDFTVENLIRRIDTWPARLCRVMAEIVISVDTQMLNTLDQYLTSPASKKRLAALQAIEYLGCATQLREQILNLLQDPRIEVRVRVIDTLSVSSDESLLPLIPQLLTDSNTDIADAASRASKRLERQQMAKALLEKE